MLPIRIQGSGLRRQSCGSWKEPNELKTLQDRFRHARHVSSPGEFSDFKKEFDDLMSRRDAARNVSSIPPERFFKRARTRVEAGHYDFEVDSKGSDKLSRP